MICAAEATAGGDDEPALGPRGRRVAHGAAAVFLALLVVLIFRPWLAPFHQPQRGGPDLPFRAGDLTPLFSVWTQVAAHSIFERHEWPLWSDHIYCGEPFFAKPQIGVISLTTAMCALLPAHLVATWTFLLHLWIAGIAAYIWCLDGCRLVSWSGAESAAGAARGEPGTVTPGACLAALSGAVAFMLSGLMAEHAMMGHGPIVLVACWTPLVLRYLCRALSGTRPMRDSAVCGALLGVQLLAGGETMFLYNAIASAIVGLAWLFASRRRDSSDTCVPTLTQRLPRAVIVAGLVGLAGFGLSAVKVLPGLALMPLSNRAGGLPLEDARGAIIEFHEPAVFQVWSAGVESFRDLRHVFLATFGLAVIGLVSLGTGRRTRWLGLAAALLIGTGIAVAHSGFVFEVLWRYLPMFSYQRIPQRALVVSYLGLSILVAAGGQRLIWVGRRRVRVDWISAVAGSVTLAAVSAEAWIGLPPLPPTADIRREIRENEILNDLARRAGEFRIHAIESVDRNWGIEHVTVPLGLSNLAGWDHLWLRDYLGAEGTVGREVRPYLQASYQARHTARFWGMMNVRFVTATHPVELPGLQFLREFAIARSSQPAKSAGPLLYENQQWQPRARVVRHGVYVRGDAVAQAEAIYALLDHREFDPASIAVLHAPAGGAAPDQMDAASTAALIVPEHPPGKPRGLEFPNVPVVTYSLQPFQGRRVVLWSDPDAVARLLAQLAGPDAGAERGADAVIERRGQNSVRVRLAPGAGYLLLADKYAHFPGWRCTSSAGPRRLKRANSMATAVPLDGTERWVELTYCPPGLTIGLWTSVASFVLVLSLAAFGDRVRRT